MYNGKTQDEIINIFNNINSDYTVQVERDGKIFELELNLHTSEFKNVTSIIFEEDREKIGYIKLREFTFNSYEEFKVELDNLNNNNITSLIIDIRDNLGGEQSNMINIASLFLSKNKIVFKAQKRDKEEIFYSKGKGNVSYRG